MLLRLALLLPAIAWSQDWARFRGTDGAGVSNGTGFPAKLDREQSLWRTPVQPGKSSPILTRKHIFITGSANGKLFTQCLDRKTGKLLWERSEQRAREELGNVRNDPAAVTPVTDGENVYVFFPEFGLVSYDAAGKTRWKTPLGPFTNIMGLAASPILAGDSVIIVADQQVAPYIAAFDRRNGEIRWKASREEQDGWATPLLHRPSGAAPQVLTVSRGQLGAHSATDGKRLWSYNKLSPAIVSSPVLIQDTLYTFGYGNESATPFSNMLTRYDKNHDGKLSPDEYGNDAFLRGIGTYEGNRDSIVSQDEWDAKQQKVLAASRLVAVRLEPDGPRELWSYEKNFVGVVPSPLVYDDVLYIIRNGGILTSFDAKTGAVVKTGRVPGAIGGYSASPVAAEGRIYLASEDGKIAVLRAAAEWDVLAVTELGEACYATPALSEGRVYLRTSDAMYCFGKQ